MSHRFICLSRSLILIHWLVCGPSYLNAAASSKQTFFHDSLSPSHSDSFMETRICGKKVSLPKEPALRKISGVLGKGVSGAVYALEFIASRNLALKSIFTPFSLDTVELKKTKIYITEMLANQIFSGTLNILAKNIPISSWLTLHRSSAGDIAAFRSNMLFEVMDMDLFSFAEKKFAIEQVRLVIYQLLRILEVYQEFGLIHRDIKLDNILLSFPVSPDRPVVSLIDLATMTTTRARNEAFFGTCEYGVPEVNYRCQGFKGYKANSDIWLAGVVLYAMLSGNFFMDSSKINDEDWGSYWRLARRFLNELSLTPDLLAARWSRADLDEGTLDLLKQMLVLEPSDRKNATELLAHPVFDGLESVYPKIDASSVVNTDALEEFSEFIITTEQASSEEELKLKFEEKLNLFSRFKGVEEVSPAAVSAPVFGLESFSGSDSPLLSAFK